MAKCAYCSNDARGGMDALGLPACADHHHEADGYVQRTYGYDPNADPMLYCQEHSDRWEAGCKRCEACCQHHYGMSVDEKFPPGEPRPLTVLEFDSKKEFFDLLREMREKTRNL